MAAITKVSIPSTLSASASGTEASASPSSFSQVLNQGAVGSSYDTASPSSATAVSASSSTTTDASSFSAMLTQQAAQNMQYLELQNQMQQENQTFSTLSNVMKVRSDTAKNSISNIH